MTHATFRSTAAVDGPPGYRERTGQLVTIVEPVAAEQDPDADDTEVATLYRVRFEDGVETEAFEDELDTAADPSTPADD